MHLNKFLARGTPYLLAAGLALTGQTLFADGGIKFYDITANGGAGVHYQRFGTPARLADLQAFYDAGVDVATFGFNVLAMTPQKPKGAPGLALFDFDNDGDLDIYVTNGPGAPNSLFRNRFAQTGRVTFADVAHQAGVEALSQDSTGVCFGDIDNDGWEDFYVTATAMPGILYHNNKNGTFTDISASSSATGGNFHSSGCAMADFNGDGYLDIAIGNTYDNWLGRPQVFLPTIAGVEPNQLFLRRPARPGIKFEDVSTTSGIRNLGPYANDHGASYTWAIAAVDYDQDGDVDIMWADTNGPPPQDPPNDSRGWIRVLRNDGRANFTDVTQAAGMDKEGSWMGLSYGDFNCDGAIDVFVTNLGNYVGGASATSRHFLGDGAGGFTDPGVGPHIQATLFGWGTSVIDYDNDGDQDIFYYGDDDLLNLYAMDNKGTVLKNNGCNADFSYDTTTLVTDHRRRTVNGVASGDLNNDGFQDVATVAFAKVVPVAANRVIPFTAATGPLDPVQDAIAQILLVMARTSATATKLTFLPGTNFPNGDLAVEMNSGGNGNGSAEVKLLGTKGLLTRGKNNRDGIGAVLHFTPDGGDTVILPLVGGGSHVSQDSRILHFGLGSAPKGTLEVNWPGGINNILYDVSNHERVTMPEIPCKYDLSDWSAKDFNRCVNEAVTGLRNAGVITAAQGDRIKASAVQFSQQ
jgi:hypothetical protein